MFYLHTSNRTENLLQQLASLIEADPQDSIFDRECIVIQSKGMERIISQAMARSFTSWCGYSFYLPLHFLGEIAKRLDIELSSKPFERSVLCWRIEKELGRYSDTELVHLQHYIVGNGSGLRRYQLARKLAHLFDQYQLMRPEMLMTWGKGRRITDSKDERWQMVLWNQLIKRGGDDDHRGRQLQRVMEFLRDHKEKTLQHKRLPKRVSIFGVTILPPLFIEYFNALSLHCDVHLFLLSPTQNYWGSTWSSRYQDPDDSSLETGHPLLHSYGRQGQEFQEILLNRVQFEREFTSYETPSTTSCPTLLQTIQADILDGGIPTDNAALEGDSSLRIVSCHSRLRELEILKDHILDLLNAPHDLGLHEIVVMAPDIQQYGPFIPVIFEGINHSIADRSLSKGNRYIAIFKEFLTLMKGRFGWSEVLTILKKEEVFRSFDLQPGDIDILQSWVVGSGIRWGLSGEQRLASGFHSSLNTWKAGLERMMLGYALDSTEPFCHILPLDRIEGGSGIMLGRLCDFVTLIEDGAALLNREYDLREWAEVLKTFAHRLFGQQEQKQFLELLEIVNRLNDFDEFHHGSVALSVIVGWLEGETSDSHSLGGFLQGQLTFCSMLPMRSIPFKAVCLLGLNYSEFPKQDQFLTFDLMRRSPRLGDRSYRIDGRYQFLEAILSTREILYLSYIGQSLADNKEIPPSVVISELLDVLHDIYKVTSCVEKHPLYGFNQKYFMVHSPLSSYDTLNYEVARNLSMEREESKGWWTTSLPEATEVIRIEDLIRFYSHPQRYFVETVLGIAMRDELLPEESEIFQPTPLIHYHVKRGVIEAMAKGCGPYEVRDLLMADGFWPEGSSGEVLFQRVAEQMLLFHDRITALKMGERREDLRVSLDLGRFRLEGQLPNIYENGILLVDYGTLKGRDLLVGWLHYLVAQHGGLGDCRVGVITEDKQFEFGNDQEDLPSFTTCLETYERGCREPSCLIPGPGFEYCKQKSRPRARVSPLDHTRKYFQKMVENGYEPSWSLLWDGDCNRAIGDEFTQVTEEIVLPLWRMSHAQ